MTWDEIDIIVDRYLEWKRNPDCAKPIEQIEKELNMNDDPELIVDTVKARGVGLKESEWANLEEMGQEFGSNAHALAAWAIRDFIKRYERGHLPIIEVKRLPGL